LFDKSRTLYLIDKAKGPIRKSEQAVIVEGYTDALMAHQAGFENVVASLGTALTPNQIGLLTRYANRIALAYDVDAAGEKAGTVGVTALAGLITQLQGDDSGVKLEDVRVARLPDGKDPDELIRDDPPAWQSAVTRAKPLVEYLIDLHASRFDLKTATGRIGFVDAVIPSIRDIADPLRRDEALQQMHRVSGVDERVLRQSLERRLAAVGPGRRDRTSRITADAVLAAPDALPVGDILKAVTPVEAELLRLLLLLPDQQLRVADQLGPDQLPSTLARELFRALVLHRAPNDQGVRPPFDLIAFIAGLPDDEVRSLAQAAMALQKPQPEAREVAGLLLDIEDDRIRERSEYIESALAEAERAGDAPTVDQLQREQRQINETRRSIDRRREQTRLLARPVAAAQT
jgi:DNA primase